MSLTDASGIVIQMYDRARTFSRPFMGCRKRKYGVQSCEWSVQVFFVVILASGTCLYGHHIRHAAIYLAKATMPGFWKSHRSGSPTGDQSDCTDSPVATPLLAQHSNLIITKVITMHRN